MPVTMLLMRAKAETETGTGWSEADSALNIRVGLGADVKVVLAPAFAKSVASHDFVSVTSAKGGAAFDYTYRLRLNAGVFPADFVKELNQIEGVQSVDLRRGEPVDV